MLTPSNIYRIDFEESFDTIRIPHSVIFNITQITEEEVYKAIKNNVWDLDDRIIELRSKQIKYLSDKKM